MIFVTLGSQKFQFNRLLIEIDKLVENGLIKEEVFAQIGYSDYKPKNYEFKEFLNRDEFADIMNKCDKVITHGGTGAIIGAVKKSKKVIAVPRLKQFGEHVDDHQIEIVNQFKEMNLSLGIEDVNEIRYAIKDINKYNFNQYKSNTIEIINNLISYIQRIR